MSSKANERHSNKPKLSMAFFAVSKQVVWSLRSSVPTALSTSRRRSTGKKAVQLFHTSNHSVATCFALPAVPLTSSSNTSTLSIPAKCPFPSFGTTFTATSPKPHQTSHYTPPTMTWSASSTQSHSTDSSMQFTPLSSTGNNSNPHTP